MRLIVGAILLIAGSLNAFQSVSMDVNFDGGAGSFERFRIVIEICLGVISLLGWGWTRLRWIATGLFACFALYSLMLVASGAESCGCFGPLQVDPRLTFVLDLAVVLGLSASLMGKTTRERALRSLKAGRLSVVPSTVVLGVAGLFVCYAQGAMRGANSQSPNPDITVLQPGEWIGEPLPIARSINVDVSHGHWRVLLHRRDCGECQLVLPEYLAKAAQNNIALIEVPPHGAHPLNGTSVRQGQLQDDREWFVQTPVEIELVDGVVVSVRTEFLAVDASPSP